MKSQSECKYRQEDFKLGRIHGRILPKHKYSEAYIRQKMFLTQIVDIVISNEKKVRIRLFGYEVPLKKDIQRGNCVDLMGYDEEHNLYLFELKKKGSSKDIGKAIEQLDKYRGIVEEIKDKIAKELKNELLQPIEFNRTKTIILAPREFYGKKDLADKRKRIDYFGFFRDKDINKRKSNEVINIYLANKCNS